MSSSQTETTESEHVKKPKSKKTRKNEAKEQVASETEIKVQPKQIALSDNQSQLAHFFRLLCEKNLKAMIVLYSQLLEKNLKFLQVKVLEIWNEVSAKSGLEIDINSIISENETDVPNPVANSKKMICQHYMPKAKRNCDYVVSSKSKTKKYCTQHLKQEEKEGGEVPAPSTPRSLPRNSPAEKKQCVHESKNGTRCEKNISEKDEEGKHCSKHFKSSLNKAAQKSEKDSAKDSPIKNSVIVLRPRRHSSLNVFIDTETGFVIDDESKKIYGKLDSEQILPLQQKDVEWLQKNHYEYDLRGSCLPL
jgi:hypothetical protein